MTQDRSDAVGGGTGAETTEEIEHARKGRSDADQECLVIELRLPVDSLPFGEALASLDGVRVEFEQIVPTSENPLPYLWVDGGNSADFETAASADPTVERARHVSDLNGSNALYELEWTDLETTLWDWFDGGDGTILQLDGQFDEWHLKMRIESRAALGAFQDHCEERGIGFELVRLYRLTEAKMGQYNVSEKQFEALLMALELGYFEIPRDATLGDLANELGISKRAASERLRRGQTNLLHNSLIVGSQSGIGVE